MYTITINNTTHTVQSIRWVRELQHRGVPSKIIGSLEHNAQGLLYGDQFYHVTGKPKFIDFQLETVTVERLEEENATN